MKLVGLATWMLSTTSRQTHMMLRRSVQGEEGDGPAPEMRGGYGGGQGPSHTATVEPGVPLLNLLRPSARGATLKLPRHQLHVRFRGAQRVS